MADVQSAFFRFKQLRITPLLETGAVDPSGTAVTSTTPKEMSVKFVYKEGEENESTAGDGSIFCNITEADVPKGADLDLTMTTVEYLIKEAIAGGVVTADGDDNIGWDMPTAASNPFQLEAWVPRYEVDESSEGKAAGYLKVTCPFCKGRASDGDIGEKKFMADKFSIKARSNPNSGVTGYAELEVDDLT
jgi:hypothetical protein